jgi:cytochrome c peroxidase
MFPQYLLYQLLLALVMVSNVGAQPIDFDNLPNYANQSVPNYIEDDNTPANNPITDSGAMLGRVLFYDKRLSRDDTVSCSSCHQQSTGFSDPAVASSGVAGTTGRHSMRLINARFADEFRAFWDERADSIEDQATQPIQDHVEMGFSGEDGDPTFADLITKMEATQYYPALFENAFGDETISETRMQLAIAQFVRSIQSFDSKYDQGAAMVQNLNGPFPNFTMSENRGKQLFQMGPDFDNQGIRTGGGIGCGVCHQPPEFDINPNSQSNGVITSIGGATDLTNTRSPSLRDVLGPTGAPNGPFMHDGSKATLRDVLLHYNSIPPTAAAPPNRRDVDNRLLPGGNPQQLQMTEQEITDVLAFLATLTGSNVYTDPKWSDPFDENGNLQIVGIPVISPGWVLY